MDSLAEAGSASKRGDAAPVPIAPGSLGAQWERVLTTPRGTHRARMSLSVALALLVLLASVAAWQAFVHSSLGARLRGMNEIVFVGGHNPGFVGVTVSSSSTSSGASSASLPQLYVMQPDGSGLRQLTHLARGFYFSPVWSPDGTRIAAFSVSSDNNLVAHLVVMDADGSNARVISSVAFSLDTFNQASAINFLSGSISIDWSPDGSQLVAWLSVGQYMLVNVDGTHPRVLSGFLPVWSPDGRYLAFYMNAPADQNGLQSGSGVYTIALLDTQTSKTRELNGLPGLNAEALAWSPDGRYLAVSAAWGGSFQSVPTDSIVLMRPDGTGLKVVDQWTNEAVEQVAWSPDSQKLAVVLQDFAAEQQGNGPSNGGSSLVVVNADGSHIQRVGLTDGGQPSWSPDGKHLVFANPDDTTLLVADTSVQPLPPARALVDSLALLFAPCWSPLAGI